MMIRRSFEEEMIMSDDQYWKERTREALAQIKENVERIAELEASIDKNDEWAKGFIEKTDARIAELEAALKLMIDTQDDWEKGVSEVIGKQPNVFNRAIDAARKVLGEK